MKPYRLLALIVSAACCLGNLHGQVWAIATPGLRDVLKLKAGQSIVFQPFKLQSTQSLDVTHLRFGDGSVKPGEQKSVQLIVYSAKPDQAGQYEVLFEITLLLERSAPPARAFTSFQGTDETSRTGIIAVLIGLTAPANQPNASKPTVLPGKDSFTAEIKGTGIGLLLPAVQKVREAAR